MRKIGGYLIQWAGLTTEERLTGFINAGFEFLALSMPGIYKNNENFVTPEMADKFGMEVQNVHLTGPGTNNIWLPGTAGEEITQRYCDEIKLVASYGIKTGITHVTWGSNVVPPPVSEVGIERFRRIADCAEKCDFTLALENSVTSEHLYYAFERLDSGHIGFCYDSGHRYCYTPEADFVSKLGDRMVAMHLDDNDGFDDIHMLPYDGIAPWDDVIRDLGKTEMYRNYVLLELNGRIHRNVPGLSAAQIRERLKNTKIVDDGRLVEIRDGSYDMYGKLSYEEYLARAYDAFRRIAQR